MLRIQCVLAVAASALTGALAYRGGLAAAVHSGRRALEESGAQLAAAAEELAEQSPIKRVVQLLGKMAAELRAEADQESAMYDKMVCWCDTNEKEKTQAIADAETKDLELNSEIESRSARFGNLATEIAEMKEQIAKDTEALETATAIREKGAAEFRDEEKDMVQAIDNLRNAIAVLAKHHGGSLLQVDAPLVSGMRVLLRDAALKYAMLRPSVAERHRQPRTLAELLQTTFQAHLEDGGLHSALLSALDINGASMPESLPLNLAQRLIAEAAHKRADTSSFFQASERQPVDADYKSYSARSTQIWGVLNQMLEEFNAELSQAQKDELKAIEDYKALAKAKRAQIATGKEKLDDMEGDHAENQKALSDAKEDLDLTRKQRSADVEFMRKLKVTCMDLDREWERRSATRSEELKAVMEAIAILTEDDNREMLAKSVSLLQEQERAHSATDTSASYAVRRTRAVQALRRAAAEPVFEADDLLAAWHSRRGASAVGAAAGPRAQLAVLAMSAQLDSFTEVKKMMDTMVAELKEQQKEEADFKAYCNKEFDENEKATYSKTQYRGDLESKLDALAALMTKLQKEIVEAKAQIAAMEVQIRKASENREAENAEFQMTVTDQRATQAILQKALLRLQDFYTKGIGKKVIYLQRSGQTPPVQFTKYKANSGSSPVMGLLEQIIGDSKTLEAEATASEYKAQADYEQFTNDSNTLIAELQAAVTAKSKATAAAKLDAAEADADRKSTIAELESLAAYEADLHGQCDFVLKNFDIRQKARLQEMEAIQAAKAILSGAQGSR